MRRLTDSQPGDPHFHVSTKTYYKHKIFIGQLNNYNVDPSHFIKYFTTLLGNPENIAWDFNTRNNIAFFYTNDENLAQRFISFNKRIRLEIRQGFATLSCDDLYNTEKANCAVDHYESKFIVIEPSTPTKKPHEIFIGSLYDFGENQEAFYRQYFEKLLGDYDPNTFELAFFQRAAGIDSYAFLRTNDEHLAHKVLSFNSRILIEAIPGPRDVSSSGAEISEEEMEQLLRGEIPEGFEKEASSPRIVLSIDSTRFAFAMPSATYISEYQTRLIEIKPKTNNHSYKTNAHSTFWSHATRQQARPPVENFTQPNTASKPLSW